MILKEADDRQADLAKLRALANHPQADVQVRKRIEQEIKNIQSGMRAESEAAYDMKVHLGPSANWMIMHDLRLEFDGVVAQIDHLLANRFMEFYVCESKNFCEGVAVNEQGEFTSFFGGKPRGVASPLEQNQRHVTVLGRVFRSGAVALPKRLGMTISPALKNFVLVSKNARISRPKKEVAGLDCLIKTDQFIQRILNHDNDGFGALASLAKTVSPETLRGVCEQIIQMHSPIQFDWAAKFGIAAGLQPKAPMEAPTPCAPCLASEKTKYACAACSEAVPYNVAKFCWLNKPKFGGQIFCRGCQPAAMKR